MTTDEYLEHLGRKHETGAIRTEMMATFSSIDELMGTVILEIQIGKPFGAQVALRDVEARITDVENALDRIRQRVAALRHIVDHSAK